MACQLPAGVLANFKEQAKRLYPLRYWPSERRRNSPKERGSEGLISKWPGACVPPRSQVAKDILARGTLAAGHFELNDW